VRDNTTTDHTTRGWEGTEEGDVDTRGCENAEGGSVEGVDIDNLLMNMRRLTEAQTELASLRHILSLRKRVVEDVDSSEGWGSDERQGGETRQSLEVTIIRYTVLVHVHVL